MAHEVITQTNVKRTLYVAECAGCRDRVERDINPPRERFCTTCHKWVPFKAVSVTASEFYWPTPDPNKPWRVQ